MEWTQREYKTAKECTPGMGRIPANSSFIVLKNFPGLFKRTSRLQLRKISFDGPLTHRYRLCLADLLVLKLLTIEIHNAYYIRIT